MDIFRRYNTTFAALPVVYWPWIWLQIWRVLSFTKRTGRKVLFTFDHSGRIIIRFVADAAAPETRYRYTAPDIPSWRQPALASDLPTCAQVLKTKSSSHRPPNNLSSNSELFIDAYALNLIPP